MTFPDNPELQELADYLAEQAEAHTDDIQLVRLVRQVTEEAVLTSEARTARNWLTGFWLFLAVALVVIVVAWVGVFAGWWG